MGEQGKVYYFAYAGNMNLSQIKMSCASPKKVAVAKIDDHKLEFYDYAKMWDGAQETLTPEPGSEVWGVIYELNMPDTDKLDLWHNVKFDGSGFYFHSPAKATAADGTQYDVLFYKKNQLVKAAPPSRQYVEYIVKGARESGLPEDYIARLEAVETKEADYKVPRLGELCFGESSDSECSCG